MGRTHWSRVKARGQSQGSEPRVKARVQSQGLEPGVNARGQSHGQSQVQSQDQSQGSELDARVSGAQMCLNYLELMLIT